MSTSYNLLPGNAFDFRIEGLKEVSFKLTRVSVPTVETPSASLPWRDATQYFTGDQIVYSPLQIEFKVDEDLKNYEEILTWMLENQWGKSEKVYRDAIIATLTNSSSFNRQFILKNAFPESVGSLDFTTEQGTDITYVTCTSTFRFSELILLPYGTETTST